MLRLISMLIFLAMASAGSWWSWQNIPAVRSVLEPLIPTWIHQEVLAFEPHYTEQHILQWNRSSKSDTPYTISLKYSPYLLMEIKYLKNNTTKETLMLWSLTDGEMILDTHNWDRTHGFEDALLVYADKQDFLIIQTLYQNQGQMTVDAMIQKLPADSKTARRWIQDAITKHLIAKQGNRLLIHLQNPRLTATPETKLAQGLIAKPVKGADTLKQKYSQSKIEKVAQAAFGNDFAIRKSEIVYLPVYQLEIQKTDGTTTTSWWNAVTGQKFESRFFLPT